MADTGLSIKIEDYQWEEAGELDQPASRLHVSLYVNAVLFHATALQVRELRAKGTHTQQGVTEDVERELTALYALDENVMFSTTEINGRTYVVYFTPGGA